MAGQSSRPHVSGFGLRILEQGERLRLATMLAGVGTSPWSSPLYTSPGFSEGGLQGGLMYAAPRPIIRHPGSIRLRRLCRPEVSLPPPGERDAVWLSGPASACQRPPAPAPAAPRPLLLHPACQATPAALPRALEWM